MAGKFRISRGRWISLGLLGTGVAAVCVWIAMGQGERAARAKEAASAGIYRQDIPRDMMPSTLLPGLVQLSPEQIVRIPIADGFQSPLGTPNGAFTYDAQPFGSPNPTRGGNHTGQDLNGIGGANTDEGQSVYAAGRGLVVYAGKPHAVWGNVVVLAHRLPGDARVIQTLYAHLAEIHVRTGQLLPRGARVGTVGTADGAYLAHLHFEAIASRCTEAGMHAYMENGVMNRIDPEELLAHHPAPALPDPYSAVRLLRIREAALQAPATETPQNMPEGSLRVNPSQFL